MITRYISLVFSAVAVWAAVIAGITPVLYGCSSGSSEAEAAVNDTVYVVVKGTRRDTDGQPTFPEVWAKVADRIKGLPLVAHNRPFDESCLKAAFEEYGMEYPGYEFHCTLAASRRCLDIPSHQLHLSAAACGYDMENHHHALCDAEACATIALKLL